MKIVKLSDSLEIAVTKSCIAREYPKGDRDIWGAIIRVNGRYPIKGETVNEECKELVYFLEGNGKLVVDGEEYVVSEGDQLVIDKGEKFHWEGNLVMFMPCTPAWYPEQHKTL